MRATASVIALLAFAVLGPWHGEATAQGSPAHSHIGHVMDAFRGTPEGQGLLPAAAAEAEVAARHAGLALTDLTDLDGMKRHTGHVLNAVDPSVEENGPGLGYGVKAAADRAARHIALAAASEGATDNIRTHANHAATSATNTVTRVDQIVELGQKIMEAESAEDAAPMMEELAALANQLVAGLDADGDGRVGWQEGEGGLEVATTHMGIMKRGEGLP